MTPETGHEMSDLILALLGIIWAFQIGFHFNYLKAIDSNIKEINFFFFLLNPENMFRAALIISPLFVSTKDKELFELKRKRKRASISTYVLLAMFMVTITYLYNYPPKKEIRIAYDLTKGGR